MQRAPCTDRPEAWRPRKGSGYGEHGCARFPIANQLDSDQAAPIRPGVGTVRYSSAVREIRFGQLIFMRSTYPVRSGLRYVRMYLFDDGSIGARAGICECGQNSANRRYVAVVDFQVSEYITFSGQFAPFPPLPLLYPPLPLIYPPLSFSVTSSPILILLSSAPQPLQPYLYEIFPLCRIFHRIGLSGFGATISIPFSLPLPAEVTPS